MNIKKDKTPRVSSDGTGASGHFVQVYTICKDEWIDEKGYEDLYHLFTRKIFKIGGSLAIRIPKDLAKVIGLKEGTDVKLAVKDKKLVIEPMT
ncbi:MAG: AbrB/MazE/SpoVT family DNA-binding domain-containing protein [Promethearchaeota archaeon]|nr:MAG: AbrB/MazE/SpoVT family DNA-binding domain-containing protein [Candidatus Lokiarchaeota archaeon]